MDRKSVCLIATIGFVALSVSAKADWTVKTHTDAMTDKSHRVMYNNDVKRLTDGNSVTLTVQCFADRPTMLLIFSKYSFRYDLNIRFRFDDLEVFTTEVSTFGNNPGYIFPLLTATNSKGSLYSVPTDKLKTSSRLRISLDNFGQILDFNVTGADTAMNMLQCKPTPGIGFWRLPYPP